METLYNKRSERDGGPPTCWRLESEASRINQRHNSQRHARVGQIDTADATVVVKLHAQSIVVGGVFGVGRGLYTRHKELILGGDLLLHALLLLRVFHLVSNLVQIYVHVRGPTALTFVRTGASLFDQLSANGMRMMTNSQMKHLLHKETHCFHSKLAFVVVNADDAVDALIGHKDVLAEGAAHL